MVSEVVLCYSYVSFANIFSGLLSRTKQLMKPVICGSAGARRSEVEEVKGNKQPETSVKKTDKTSGKKREQKEEEKKEVHRCDGCRWYDKSTERDFHRDGIREGLVEVRAVCRSSTSRARNHLVKNDSDRPCFEEGVYVKPEKPKKEAKKKGKKKSMTDKEANEYAEKFVKEKINNVPEKSVQRKNGDVVILEKRKGKTYVRPVNQ